MIRYLLMFSLLTPAAPALAENFSLEAHYPSPAGAYTNLTVTSSTVLARDGAIVTVGSAVHPSTLTVTGNLITQGLTIPTGAAAGRVLTSDANGNASWQSSGFSPNYQAGYGVVSWSGPWQSCVMPAFQAVNYPAPAFLPTTASAIITRFSVSSGTGGQIRLFVSASNFPARVVAESYSVGTSDDASGDTNTYIMPYSPDRQFMFRLTGPCGRADQFRLIIVITGYIP